MSKKDLEKEINILEHEIFIERVLTRAMGKNTISLRDHFAGLAMQSLLTKVSTTVGSDSVAMAAYHVAHQMLKERSRGEKRDV
jgi:hypothetical protein